MKLHFLCVVPTVQRRMPTCYTCSKCWPDVTWPKLLWCTKAVMHDKRCCPSFGNQHRNKAMKHAVLLSWLPLSPHAFCSVFSFRAAPFCGFQQDARAPLARISLKAHSKVQRQQVKFVQLCRPWETKCVQLQSYIKVILIDFKSNSI